MLRIAVFISGGGRTLQNLIFHSDVTNATKIVVVGANKECDGLQFARKAGIPLYANKDVKDYVCEIATMFRADLICLAGFTQKVRIREVTGCTFNNRIMNIHPALLPDFGGPGMYGLNVHRAVIDAKKIESGCTVHFCDSEYDNGPVVLQRKVNVEPDWDAETLAKAVFEEEKIAYPIAIESFKELFDGSPVDINDIRKEAQRRSQQTDKARAASRKIRTMPS